MNHRQSNLPNSNLLLTGMVLSVIAGGVISWFSWSNDFSSPKRAKVATRADFNAPPSTTQDHVFSARELARNPSNIDLAFAQKNSQPKTKALDQLVKYDLNCTPQPDDSPKSALSRKNRGPSNLNLKESLHTNKLIVHGGFIQLHGRACLKLKNNSSPVITNLTNGFQGAYFQAGREQYKTDLIQLNEGENKIQVEFQNASGKKYDLSFLVISHRI